MQLHPLYEQCQEKGLLVPTKDAHHRIPLSEGGTHARENLIALCKPCHVRIPAIRMSFHSHEFKEVQSIWHEGSLKVYDIIFHYWMKVYKEDNDTPVQSQSER